MRYFLSILLVFACFYTNAQKIKVLTYNIHHGNPPSKKGIIDLEAIAAVINSADVDIVAIQEVDNNVSRSNFENQAERLAELTKMEYLFTKSIPLEEGAYGTAILTRHKIVSKRRYDLPMPVKSENRTLTIVDVELAKGKIVSLANTHLDLKSQNREEQARFITEIVELYNRPLILVGDFNATPREKAIEILETSFARNNKGEATFPNINPKDEIDYIMVGKHSKFKWKKYQILKDHNVASDHLPLFGVIKFK